MKEITIKFRDKIATSVSLEAGQRGLSSEELIKFIVGTWIQGELSRKFGPMAGMLSEIPVQILGDVRDMVKKHYRDRAAKGDLKCSNCTMPLSPGDVDEGRCHLCNAPIVRGELGEPQDLNDED